VTVTLTVEGDITAADTATGLTSQGSVSAPSLVIPTDVSKIDKIIAACGFDGAADGSAVFVLRLGGAGVLGGEQTVVIAAGGSKAAQAGSDRNVPIMGPVVLENLDISVSPGDTIKVQAEMAGDDLGTANVCATLVFA